MHADLLQHQLNYMRQMAVMAAMAPANQHARAAPGKVVANGRKQRLMESSPYSSTGKKMKRSPSPPSSASSGSMGAKGKKGMDETSRKAYHREAEKKRRRKINTLVAELRALLPNSSQIPLQKPAVFTHVAQYMGALQDHRTRLESELSTAVGLLSKVQQSGGQIADDLAAELSSFSPSALPNPDTSYMTSRPREKSPAPATPPEANTLAGLAALATTTTTTS